MSSDAVATIPNVTRPLHAQIGERVQIIGDNWRKGRTGTIRTEPVTTVFVTLDPLPDDPPGWRGSIGIDITELAPADSST